MHALNVIHSRILLETKICPRLGPVSEKFVHSLVRDKLKEMGLKAVAFTGRIYHFFKEKYFMFINKTVHASPKQSYI